MVINTNIAAQTSASYLDQSSNALSGALAQLSSGSKIVSVADDVAGAAESMRLNAQISRVGAAQNNVGNAISFNQTQDGYLQEVGNALNRMSELAIMSQDATKTDSDRQLYNAEYTQLGSYITNMATKQFNGVNLFDGSTLAVTTDSDGTTYSNVGVNLAASAYTTATGSDVSSVSDAATALTNVQAAITQLSSDRANVGANISVLQDYSDQLGVESDNLSAANSRIADVDVAQESTQFAKDNILVQAGTAMLAQANATPQLALKLLQ